MPEGTPEQSTYQARTDVLAVANPVIAEAVASAVKGGEAATPEEVEMIIQEAGDSFEKMTQSGTPREVVLRMLNDKALKLYEDALGPEKVAEIRQVAAAALQGPIVSEMQTLRQRFDLLEQVRRESGPEVNSHGMNVNNPS
jgi:hypothetical protein